MIKFKEIPGFNGKYIASDDGRIYSNVDSYETTFFNKKIIRSKSKRELVGKKLSPKGYKRINLKGKVYFVHVLIALTFLGVKPHKKSQVNHKDGNKLNNNVNNLEWDTNQHNRDHAVVNKLHAFGSKLSKKLTEIDIVNIRNLYSSGIPQGKIAKKYDINQQTVSKICLYKIWKHVKG